MAEDTGATIIRLFGTVVGAVVGIVATPAAGALVVAGANLGADAYNAATAPKVKGNPEIPERSIKTFVTALNDATAPVPGQKMPKGEKKTKREPSDDLPKDDLLDSTIKSVRKTGDQSPDTQRIIDEDADPESDPELTGESAVD